jgi:hypothetical protein
MNFAFRARENCHVYTIAVYVVKYSAYKNHDDFKRLTGFIPAMLVSTII